MISLPSTSREVNTLNELNRGGTNNRRNYQRKELNFLIWRYLKYQVPEVDGIANTLGSALEHLNLLPDDRDHSTGGVSGRLEFFDKEYSLQSKDHLLRLCYGSSDSVGNTQHPKLGGVFHRDPNSGIGNSILHRETFGSSRCAKSSIQNGKFFTNRFSHQTRILGHLSCVFCIAFDASGRYIFTGADDKLVKVWNIHDGRLIFTFRGCAGEVTDLAVSQDNTLLAAGSVDRSVRVWNLQTGENVAVLMGHSATITIINFLHAPLGADCQDRYLSSSSNDGCTCMWHYNSETKQFDNTPRRFNERTRSGIQTLCQAASKGSRFLATGCSDGFIHVYYLESHNSPAGMGPRKEFEFLGHEERVDVVLWAHNDVIFASGSKDCTVKIWRYRRQEWRARIIFIEPLERHCWERRKPSPGSPMTKRGSPTKGQQGVRTPRVTMIAWSTDDSMIISAISDHSLRIHCTSTTKPLHTIIRAHLDTVYLLEVTEKCPDIFISAGHDGVLHIWDMKSGTVLHTYTNTIEGQGVGSFFDLNFSPDGLTVAAVDSHGYLNLFGIASNQKLKDVPKEQFFSTDYRPLMRDDRSFVLDEQTQLAPNLMPPPFLVDSDGNPYPAMQQRRVPGRENCTDSFLTPQLVVGSNEMYYVDVLLDASNPPESTSSDSEASRSATLPNSHQQGPAAVSSAVLRQPDVPPPATVWAHRQIVKSVSVGEAMMRLADAKYKSEIEQKYYEVETAKPPIAQAADNLSDEGRRNKHHEHRTRTLNITDYTSSQMARAMTSDSASRRSFYSAMRGRYTSGNNSGTDDEERERQRYQAELQQFLQTDSDDTDYVEPLPRAQQSSSIRRRRRGNGARSRPDARSRRSAASAAAEPAPVDQTSDGSGSSSSDSDSEASREVRGPVHPVVHFGTGEESSGEDEAHDGSSSVRQPGTSTGTRNEPKSLENERRSRRMVEKRAKSLKELRNRRQPHPRNSSPVGKGGDLTMERDWSSSRPKRRIIRRRTLSSEDEKDHIDQKPLRPVVNRSAPRPRQSADVYATSTANELPCSSKSVKTEPKEEPQEFSSADACGSGFLESSYLDSSADQNISADSQESSLTDDSFHTIASYPDYLTVVDVKRTPYFPQIDDIVVYFWQGHETYVKTVRQGNLYKRGRLPLPFEERTMDDQTFCRIVKLEFERKFTQPYTLYVLTLQILDPGTLRPSKVTFSIRYCDISGINEFIILKQHFDKSTLRHWKKGDHFLTSIDDCWYSGTILHKEVSDNDHLNSPYLAYQIKWDASTDSEKISPWDMEPCSTKQIGLDGGAMTEKEKSELSAYHSNDSEWLHRGRDLEYQRLMLGLTTLMQNSLAEQFICPVDLTKYPIYLTCIAYPMDLSTLKSRLENRFYRRLKAFVSDVLYIAYNAETFNSERATIVRSAYIISATLVQFAKQASLDIEQIFTTTVKESTMRLRGIVHNALEFDVPVSNDGKNSILHQPSGDWRLDCVDVMFDLQNHSPIFDGAGSVASSNRESHRKRLTLRDISMKVENEQYTSPEQFQCDIKKIFQYVRTSSMSTKSKDEPSADEECELSPSFSPQFSPVVSARRQPLSTSEPAGTSACASQPHGDPASAATTSARTQRTKRTRLVTPEPDSDDREVSSPCIKRQRQTASLDAGVAKRHAGKAIARKMYRGNQMGALDLRETRFNGKRLVHYNFDNSDSDDNQDRIPVRRRNR